MKNKVFMVGMIIMVMMLAQFSLLIGSVKAETITGSDGDVSWSFDSESGTLNFSGSGEITVNCAHWKEHVDCEKVNKIIIEEGVNKIDRFAFDGCNNLQSIVLPNSIEFINGYSFAYCYNLTTINISNNNPYFINVDGVIYNKNKTKIVAYPLGKSRLTDVDNYKILDSVTDIGVGAFAGCGWLKEIEIPNSVKNIEEGAFMSCASLKNVKIPYGVKSIEDYTFTACRVN